eukprot:289635-Prorocentrum_minimum.AAC.1
MRRVSGGVCITRCYASAGELTGTARRGRTEARLAVGREATVSTTTLPARIPTTATASAPTYSPAISERLRRISSTKSFGSRK